MSGLAGIQAIIDVSNWLSTQWRSANTDNIQPQFNKKVEVIGLQQNIYDYINVEYDDEIIDAFGIGGNDWRHDVPLTIECWTAKSVAGSTNLLHAQKVANEAARIIKANVKASGYAMVRIKASHNKGKDLRNVADVFVDVTLTKINPPSTNVFAYYSDSASAYGLSAYY